MWWSFNIDNLIQKEPQYINIYYLAVPEGKLNSSAFNSRDKSPTLLTPTGLPLIYRRVQMEISFILLFSHVTRFSCACPLISLPCVL